MSGRWFPWHPKGGGVHPPINLEVFFTHILATATRLNTSYGLETLHAQSSRHVGITQKVLRHIRHFWRIYDVINVGFFRHFAVFCYRKCHKVCRNSWFSHRICVLIGSTTLPSLKCNRLCVAELWRHIRRKSAISSTSLFKMTKKSDIDDVIDPSKMSDMPQNFLSDSNVSRWLCMQSFKSIRSV